MRKKFAYGRNGKLVRDKCLEFGLAKDCTTTFSYKYLEDEEFSVHLFNKLTEEAEEVITAKNKQELSAELGDLLDVIDTIIEHNNISKSDLNKIRKRKHNISGKFTTRLFVHWQELNPSPFYFHCLNNPDKYPELDIEIKPEE